MGKRKKASGFNISIVASTGKRKRLEATRSPFEVEKKPSLVTYRTKRAAKAMIKTLTPDTIRVYKPRIVKARK